MLTYDLDDVDVLPRRARCACATLHPPPSLLCLAVDSRLYYSHFPHAFRVRTVQDRRANSAVTRHFVKVNDDDMRSLIKYTMLYCLLGANLFR